jgi:hypothetical protein
MARQRGAAGAKTAGALRRSWRSKVELNREARIGQGEIDA